jgi:hypothetical protein
VVVLYYRITKKRTNRLTEPSNSTFLNRLHSLHLEFFCQFFFLNLQYTKQLSMFNCLLRKAVSPLLHNIYIYS